MIHNEFSWKSQQGVNIFSREWKPEGKTDAAVVLVHGLGEHTGRYAHVAEVLTREGFALTGFDHPGHGRTGGKLGVTSYDEAVLNIDCFIEETKQRYPLTPIFLYGHSMGGSMILYYLLKRQPKINGAISTGPGLGTVMPVPAWKRAAARFLSRLYPTFTMASGLDSNLLTRGQDTPKAYGKDPLVHGRVSARLGWELLSRGEWLIAHASEINVPLLLVQGGADQIVSPKQTAAFAKAAPADKITYKVWEGMYHETHNEKGKEEVLQYMVDWIKAHL